MHRDRGTERRIFKNCRLARWAPASRAGPRGRHIAAANRWASRSYFEASQNSVLPGQANWDNLQFVYDYLSERPRPIHHTKIYGATDSGHAFTGSNRNGSERFWRNIIGGSAASRFHRPRAGLGLGEEARRHIKSLRMLTDAMRIFTCQPHNGLLHDREPNEAYCLAEPGRQYAV